MFKDRKEGGEKLGVALEEYRNSNPLILGIPRGGIETAYYVASHLTADLSVVITRKLGYPNYPETAFGAMAEDGSIFLFEDAGLSEKAIQSVVSAEQAEINRRIKMLRKGKPIPRMKGRTIIIVDDGIATGATILATISLCKKQGAKEIIVAAPVGGSLARKTLEAKVNKVIILYTPPFFHAVSQGYQSFENLTDQEAAQILERWESEHSPTLT